MPLGRLGDRVRQPLPNWRERLRRQSRLAESAFVRVGTARQQEIALGSDPLDQCVVDRAPVG